MTRPPFAAIIRLLLIAAAGLAAAGQAQPSAAPTRTVPDRAAGARVTTETFIEAIARDAAEYARQHGVTLVEAARRLRAQEQSVPFTDALRETYRERLAGIVVEHQPVYRIVVLLAGDDPVPDQRIAAGGLEVPIVFRTGAPASRAAILGAIAAHGAEIATLFPRRPGLGADPRTGTLVVVAPQFELPQDEADALGARVAGIAGVPATVRVPGRADRELQVQGGGRLEGVEPTDGRRYACTAGYVVTDGLRDALVTAAHCPDALSYREADGSQVALAFAGQWGARYQDVQLGLSAAPLPPLFLADGAKSLARAVATWRNRDSMRAGDFVCHRGERSGYSCATVDLVDYAPPGELCGGPCDPSWIAVSGPACRPGDSGGPVFLGGTAFGILKGGSYRRDGTCSFYYYMPVDYLPAGWRLAIGGPPAKAPAQQRTPTGER